MILYIRNEVNLYQIIANAEAAETGPENVMFFTMFRSRDIHALHNWRYFFVNGKVNRYSTSWRFADVKRVHVGLLARVVRILLWL